MAKTKQKREILNPAVKGTVNRSVLKAKLVAIPRVVTTDLKSGDRVSIVIRKTREQLAGNVVSVVGRGRSKRIRVNIVGDGKAIQREFLVADCRITKIGRSGTKKAVLGFLKHAGYANPDCKVGQGFPTVPLEK